MIEKNYSKKVKALMERSFNLIKNNELKHEKRLLPRFPFCYLVFKCLKNKESQVFEVSDISFTGMQLVLKSGTHQLLQNDSIKGELHWHGDNLIIEGIVKWITPTRVGIEFHSTPQSKTALQSFLSFHKIVLNMRPLHQLNFGTELPLSLKYWFKTDGPFEIFIWCHQNQREFKSFQFIMLENFVEWKDGEGINTGRVISKRNLDTPLITEDEFVFQIDENISADRVKMALQLVEFLSHQALGQDTKQFLKLKLSIF